MMGFEESFGYLIKPFVRDKDAIQAVLVVVAGTCRHYRSRGLTLALMVSKNKNHITTLKKTNLCYPFWC